MPNKLTHRPPQLPTDLKQLTKFVLIAGERLTAVRAAIRAIDKVGLAKEVREQKLEEGQILGGAVLDAEARIGELLKAIPPNIESSGRGTIEKKKSLPDGISKKLSHQCQQLAEHRDIIEEVKAEAKEKENIPTRTEVLAKIRTVARESDRDAKRKEAAAIPPDERYGIEAVGIEEYKPDRQFDFIITDPPYPKEYLPLYETLAIKAAEWLADGGLLVAMCGQSYLDQIYAAMSQHLDYYWTAAYRTPGQPTPLRSRQVNTTWKPLLMYVKKGSRYKGKIFGDVFASDASDKSLHDWGQSESGMYSIISGICLPGQSILDPFVGAGTTGVAALRHGCLFYGCDIDKEAAAMARLRLKEFAA